METGTGMECTWSGTSLAFHRPLEVMKQCPDITQPGEDHVHSEPDKLFFFLGRNVCNLRRSSGLHAVTVNLAAAGKHFQPSKALC